MHHPDHARAATHLTESDVRRLLRPAHVIEAIEAAFRDRLPTVTIAPRTHLPLPHGVLLIMSCYDPSRPSLGIKFATVRSRSEPLQPDQLQDRVHASYLLLDPETAAPRLSIAANYLTALRTAATSALATKYLAPETVSTLGVFGTGALARTHLAVLPLVRNFQRILVCGREAQPTTAFASEISVELDRAVVAADSRTLAAESDVICTCTTSPSPLFDGHTLRPGTHLNLVGAFQPHTREVDSVTIQRARVVVDTYSGARAEAGDILIPLAENAISDNHIAADLHELVSGKKKGRLSPEDITSFKSVGCALEDLVTAELLLGIH
jgi:ornithine cyclodeaminase/alanine dehydrogenase-like protein (mu-crystallin family)